MTYIKSVIIMIIFICVVMLVLLYMSTKLPFSMVYDKIHKDGEMKKMADKINAERLQRALKYFETRAKRSASDQTAILEHHSGNLSLVVCIVTVDRSRGVTQSLEPRYLVQTTAAVDQLLMKDSRFKNKLLFLCNVDDRPQDHKDAVWLQDFIPFVQKYGDSSFNMSFTSVTRKPPSDSSKLKRHKEANDYIFCLNASRAFKSSYVLVFEDDVVPHKDIFDVIDYILRQRLHLHHDRGDQSQHFSFLKLYYPEKWQGYAWETDRLLELICFGFIGAGIFLMCCSCVCKSLRKRYFPSNYFNFLLGFLIFVAAASLLGRQALLELRRWSPQLYRFGPTPGCCVPGMLYNTNILPNLMEFIAKHDEVNQDLAISDFTVESNIPGFLLEPNLLHHIGMYSSLSADIAYKPPREFLFND